MLADALASVARPAEQHRGARARKATTLGTPMTSVVLCDQMFPLVILVAPPKLDLDAVTEYRAAIERVYARNRKYALVSYTGYLTTLPGPRERKALADWMNDPAQVANQKRLCVGSTTQLDSAIKRGFMQALNWLWTPPIPHGVHATLDEAVDWCVDLLVRADVQMPSRERLRAEARDLVRRARPAQAS
jgi:hypothetical protein